MSIQHALLALLNEQPSFGLLLHEQFEETTGNVWPVNIGQIYTTLQRLERDGYVISESTTSRRAQKNYQLTRAGRAELERWLQTPVEGETPPRDELVIKISVAAQMADVDMGQLVQVHRRAVIEMMQRYTKLKAAVGLDEVGRLLVIDAQLFRLEGIARWLDATETRLQLRNNQG
ncbi:MAG: helix-turn-helix transcriptional regulator [Anaerolineales bacterium]|nr:helix-turn-helix transcriptional regulator [Anaerolineales bacterium]